MKETVRRITDGVTRDDAEHPALRAAGLAATDYAESVRASSNAAPRPSPLKTL